MPDTTSPRPPRRFPLPAAAAALLLLSGCAGISGLEQARAMPPEQIAQQSDDFVCERLRGFGYIADVPVTWLREAQRRDLENCIDQGFAKRESDDRYRNSFIYCDRFGTGPWHRCW